MRTTFAYYLLLVYLVAVCKPVLPIVTDVVAHAFWNSGHMATVHQHSGDSHVHFETAQAATDEPDNGTAPSSKAADPVSAHIVLQNAAMSTAAVPARTQFFPVTIFFTDVASSIETPPPRV